MAQDNKKRRIISYENMAPELAEAFAEKYPRGFNDYLSDIVRYTKPDGTPFFAVTMEDAESIYLIKVKVKVDNTDDLERWFEEEDGDDVGTGAGDDGGTLPDDNIAQYGGAEDDGE